MYENYLYMPHHAQTGGQHIKLDGIYLPHKTGPMAHTTLGKHYRRAFSLMEFMISWESINSYPC